MSKPVHLLCYDIADPKRLQRVFRAASKVGQPLQYSVYIIHGGEEVLQPLLTRLSEIIDHDEDDIRIYRIGDQSTILSLGQTIMPSEIYLI